jgi:hypothetical protein
MSRDLFAGARKTGCMKVVCYFGMAVACTVCLLMAPCAFSSKRPVCECSGESGSRPIAFLP